MRVLHVVTVVDDDGSYGGALAVAVNQCVELRRRGHDARIAGGWGGSGPAPRALEAVPAHLFRVRRAAPGLGLAGLVSPGLLRWVRRHAASFDVAHLHLARELVPLLVAGRLQRLGVPYVAETHGALNPEGRPAGRLVRTTDRRATRRALLSARHVFAASSEERDAVTRVSGTARNTSLLRGGVVLPDRVPATSTSGPADVLFLGRLQPTRRVLAFAAAAERLLDDGVDATFTVVGPDGGDLRALRRFIAGRPHLDGRLRYDGALPHDRAVARLRRADLYVLPSIDTQAHPMSLLEAMAAGVPSICTTDCVLAGVLAREHAAIVANPSDEALYGAMRRGVTDRAARARLSARAAATAASEFAMAPVAEVLEEEYCAACGDTATTSATAAAAAGGTGDAGPDEARPRLLWVLPAASAAHVQVWDALRDGARLTVALTGRDRDGGPGVSGQLAGHGYPVHRLRARAGRAPRALRPLLAGPQAVVVDGLPPRARATLTRWARQAGLPVVAASDVAGPGAAARAALAVGTGGSARIDLDLRGGPGHRADAGGDVPGRAGAAPAGDVIDLQQRTRSGRHRS